LPLKIDGDDRLFIECEFLKLKFYPGLLDALYNVFNTGILFSDGKNYPFEWTSRYDPTDLGNYHFYFTVKN
jgi:hypothetical protein